MRFLAGEYTQRKLAMQLHMGALRNNNRPMFERLGPDTGYDSIGDPTPAGMLGAFLGDIHQMGALPSTVLYTINPADNPVFATMAANFSQSGVAGKVQFGSAWWFNDHLRGIRAQLDELTETGLLPHFIGMLTDSRSFTSFTRHEYFRRILCDHLGAIVQHGEYPAHYELLGPMVQDICYNNAVRFLG